MDYAQQLSSKYASGVQAQAGDAAAMVVIAVKRFSTVARSMPRVMNTRRVV
jgi:hypothetical protein